jgi:uncharacterized membrane protein YkvA (DUF1232 family)
MRRMAKIESLEDLLESPFYPRDSARLEAARKSIEAGLEKKLKNRKKIPKRLVADVEWLSSVLHETRWRKKKGVDAIIAAGLLYFISGKDGIPDKTQVIGFFDDSVVIDLVIRSIELGVAK